MDEDTVRKTLDEGQLYERNQQIIDDFIKEYGYDPIDKQTFIRHNQYEEEDEEDENENENTVNTNARNLKNSDNNSFDFRNKSENKESESIQQENKEITESVQQEIPKEDKLVQNGNCSLESLNQILDIIDINFGEIINDMIPQTQTQSTEIAPKKKRLTKKEKEEKEAKEKESSISVDTKSKLELLINNFSKLNRNCKKDNEKLIDDGIEAGLEIAKYYHIGEVLQKSYIKCNMIYVYLIKKFNDPEAMYLLGEELLNGITIQKNHKQATKLIKVAAESYKHKKAITKLKTLFKAC